MQPEKVELTYGLDRALLSPMRLIVVMAGAFGFFTAVIGGLAGDVPMEAALLNGIVAALVAGMLLRWWMKIWIKSLEKVSRDDEMSARLDRLEPK